MPTINNGKKIWSIVISLVLASTSTAQLAAEQTSFSENPEHFTVDDLVAWVWERNPGIAQRKAAVEMAVHRIDPAGSLDDPTFGYGFAPRTFGREGQGLNQKIEFSQKIPWPGTLAAREAVAKHEATMVRTDVEELRLELAAVAKSAYAEWFFIKRALIIHHSTRALLVNLRVVVETRYAAGKALQQDAIQAQMEQATLDRHLLKLKRLETSVKARINTLLNRDTAAALPLPTNIVMPKIVPAMVELERAAVDAHPRLRRLESQIAANTANVVLAKKAFYPDFQFAAGYNSLWDEPDKRPFIGLSISLPLDRSKRRAALNSAKANVRLATSERDDLRSQLLGNVAQARAELIESVESVALYENSLVPLAEEYLDGTVADYQSGTGSFLAVITAEQTKLETEEGFERSRADVLRHIAQLERWSGQVLTVQASRGDQP